MIRVPNLSLDDVDEFIADYFPTAGATLRHRSVALRQRVSRRFELAGVWFRLPAPSQVEVRQITGELGHLAGSSLSFLKGCQQSLRSDPG